MGAGAFIEPLVVVTLLLGEPEYRIQTIQSPEDLRTLATLFFAIVIYRLWAFQSIVQRIASHTSRRGTKMASERHNHNGHQEGGCLAQYTAVPGLLLE
jgi:hypothetical protein